MSIYGTILNAIKAKLDLEPGLGDFTILVRRKPRIVSGDAGSMCIVSPGVESVSEYSFGGALQVAYPVMVSLFIDSERLLSVDAHNLLDARQLVREVLYTVDLTTVFATDVDWDPNPPFDGAGLSVMYDHSSQVFTYTLEHSAN